MESSASPVERQTLKTPGLEKPVEIIVDQWGIPHIYAATILDAFFAQGLNAARDRLWQIDLWRKRGLGRLAESFGPAHIEQDKASRHFLYRGPLEAEWAIYGPNAEAWATAFVAGINAYVRLVQAGKAPLPVEFELTSSKPDLWEVGDLVRIRSHGLNRNAEFEALRARVVAAGGVQADRLRRKLEPAHDLAVPEGLDPNDIPEDVMAMYLLAAKDVTFAAPDQGDVAAAKAPSPDASEQGSNNWVVGPSRTATGRPILANDPHRALTAPSIRYISHLEAPGLSVIGAGELHVPGVTVGHNGKIAFGITVSPIDQEDIYVYQLNPDNPWQYRYEGGWEDLRVVRETLNVKGEASREVEVLFTRHGAVLKVDPDAGRAFALRTVWSEAGTSSYFGGLRYQQAADWADFKAAVAHWRTASMNIVYADVEGNIGWVLAALAPRRRNWDGLFPVPGDGRYEWDGFLGPDELPSSFNPEKGWIETANEMNLPESHVNRGLKIGFEWADPSRTTRINQVLAANDASTIADNMALQMDDQSHAALRAVGLLRGLSSTDAHVSAALDLLMAWDGHEGAESAAAAIAEVWMTKHLTVHTIARTTPPAAAKQIGLGSPYAVVDYLKEPDDALGPDPIAARTEILLESLATALDELTMRLGPGMARWAWGDLHQITFSPPVAQIAGPALKARLAHPRTPLPGGPHSVRAGVYNPDDFSTTIGASFRMVIDVGSWDDSMAINGPGQSGDPSSPHYRDHLAPWARGDYVPLLYSRAAIDKAARLIITLTP